MTRAAVDRNHTARELARRLAHLMADQGLSQADLARKIWGSQTDPRGYEVARNRDRISTYLRGVSMPSPENLKQLADALGVTPDDLLPGSGASPVDQASPPVSIEVVAGMGKVYLRVNMTVDMATAMKVAGVLDEYEKRPGAAGDTSRDKGDKVS